MSVRNLEGEPLDDETQAKLERACLEEDLKCEIERKNRISREASDVLGRDGAKSPEEAGGIKGEYWRELNSLKEEDEKLTTDEYAEQHQELYDEYLSQYKGTEQDYIEKLADSDRRIAELRQAMERLEE